MKVVFCWSHISGYMAACWRALQAAGVDFSLIAYKSDAPGGNIAFTDDLVAGINHRLLDVAQQSDKRLIRSLVIEKKPDIVVIPGWFNKGYTTLVQNESLSRAKFIMTMDTPRRDTIRQKLGKYIIGGLLGRMDRVVVAGERAWQLATLLDIPEAKIRRGLYGVDFARLSQLYRQRRSSGWPKQFLYVGRYEHEKGLDLLLQAYGAYRSNSRDPWGLTCCGAGAMKEALSNQPGVVDRGFVHPAEQDAVFASHGVFVLPSRYDPWPLVIVEACAAGLPVIHSEACGSAVELVRNYYSGRGFATGDVGALSATLHWCEDHFDQMPTMGQRAQPLAEPYSAENWAVRWIAIFDELMHQS